jgi:CO/xanthine dehydrogenase Mo-binding subunit
MTMVGKSIPKIDGLGHVTGTTPYVDDVFVKDTLICKGFRSPVAKGKIKNIDISKAQNLSGVFAVLTCKDVPCNRYSGDWPVFAEEEVCFRGQLIAAVAAVDEDTAQEAVSLIEADIEEETPYFDPRETIKPGSPLIKAAGNVLKFGEADEKVIHLGDVEEGFRQADYIVENEYYYPVAEHSPLEPQTSLAVPTPEGKLNIYTTSQCLYYHLNSLIEVLQLPMSKVNLVGGTVGGGFGGKNDLHADPVTALLALKTMRPVKWRWTREEELTCSTVRGAWIMKIKDGVTKDGRIIARYMDDLVDGGAFASLNLYASKKHAYFCAGPYYIPNIKVRVRCAFTNKVPSSSMRGFGLTGCAFAQEVQMEKIAKTVGMDSYEIRLINALRKGEPTHTGSVPDSVAAVEVLQKLAANMGVKLGKKFALMSSDERRQ